MLPGPVGQLGLVDWVALSMATTPFLMSGPANVIARTICPRPCGGVALRLQAEGDHAT